MKHFPIWLTALLFLASCHRSAIALTEETTYPVSVSEQGEVIQEALNPYCPPREKVEYNADGTASSRVFINPDGSIASAYVYEYQHGREVKAHRYTSSGSAEEVVETSYNPDGTLREVRSLTAFGTSNYTTRFTYAPGIEEQTSLTPLGEVFQSARSELDARGQKTSTAYTTPDGSVILQTYVYDAHGRVTSQTERIDSSLTTWTFTYTDEGLPLTQTTRYADGSETRVRHEYTYDSRHNWVTRLTFDDDTPTLITHRTVTYR